MSELPNGWAKCKLSEFSVIEMGQSPKGEFVGDTPIGLPFYQGKAEFGKWYPTPRKYCSQPTKIAEKNDILLSIRAPVGPTNLCPEKSCIGRGLASIRAFEEKSQKYLIHYFRYLEPWLSEQGTGSTFKAISGGFIRDIDVLVAPLNEQIRIADKLDSILAKVDRAQARLDKIPGIIKRFRQSVLAAATSGELTREWRGNKDANWETTVFGDLIKNGPQNGIYKPSSSYGSGTKIIRIDGFYDGNLSPWSTIKRVQLDESELSKWKLNVDDILINRVNSIEYLGKCGHVDALPEDAVFESNIMRVELDKARAIPRFIKYFLSSTTGLSQLRANAKHAVNQASINQTDVKSVEIQLPSIEEQTIIVNKVEALFLKADYFEKQYSDAKKLINKLGQSSLTKAFRGELVEQNDTEEPASQLLARIKQQQLEAPKATRQTRKLAAKLSPSVDVVETDVELAPQESEILALLKNATGELSAQQIMDKLTEKTFEQVDALFTELRRLLDNNSIVKVGSGEACTFKAIKR